MEETVEQFRHEPLDLNTNSIRLIEIVPSASRLFQHDDSIECKIRHGTTDEEYVCLSYVWGPDDRNRNITINGKRFEVRRNLWDFLRSASKRPRARTSDKATEQSGKELDFRSLWVDALCIDQENLRERNHQVQQMGRIYRNAQYVVAWMGLDYRVAILLDGTESTSGLSFFCTNQYWTRAWITQEIALSRDVYFFAALKAINIHSLIQRGPYFEKIPTNSYSTSNTYCPGLYHLNNGTSKGYNYHVLYDMIERNDKYNLLENMWRFQDRICSNWQDAVYSLLSMSTDAADFEVRYDVSKNRLALDVMHMYTENFCSCVAAIVYRALKVDDSDLHVRDEMFAELRIPTSEVHDQDYFGCSRCSYRVLNLREVDLEESPSKTVRVCCLNCTHLQSRLPGGRFNHVQGHLVLEPQTSLEHMENQAELRWKASWNGTLTQFGYSGTNDKDKGSRHDKTTILSLDAGLSVAKIDKDGNAVLCFSTIGMYKLISACFRSERAGSGNHTRIQLGKEMQANDPVWKLLV